MAPAPSRGGAGGAVVVQRAACVSPVLLLFSGHGSEPGLGWRGAPLDRLLRCGALGAVALGRRFLSLSPGTGGPHEAAAQLCSARHGLHTQPQTHRAAAQWGNGGSRAVALHWFGTGGVWDYAAQSHSAGHAALWRDPPGQWQRCGARCDGVWSDGLCAGKEKHEKAKTTKGESVYSNGAKEPTMEGVNFKSVKFVVKEESRIPSGSGSYMILRPFCTLVCKTQ